MMEERRRCKRLALDVSLELERLDKGGITTLKYVHVEVSDLSKTGIGFHCNQDLEVGTFYNAKLQIWTKEVIDTILKIVRKNAGEDEIQYGAAFVGMTDTDALKIEIYQMFDDAKHDEEEASQNEEA